ncbi:MAG: TolB family protein [Gammaproteobacteria bacterium]
MAILNRLQSIPVSLSALPPACARLDRVMALLCSWLVLGLYIDGWAHRHVKIETFFTPWHLILYAGFVAVASYLLLTWHRNHVQGYPWRRAMPPGYELSLLGLLIFVLSGCGDLIWHELFGFEHDLEALLSPTHLILALGGTLMIAGPFRSAWQRPDHPSARSLATQWPMLVSLTLLLSILTFFTQFAHPFVETRLVQDMARWDVQREIFVMQADGSGQTRLARTPAQSLTHPCWSADGRRIVFAAGTWTYNENAPSDAEIYVMNADGTDPKRLTDNDSYDGHPCWSPDGSQIVFESLRDGTRAIYVMQADGSKQTRITHGHGKQLLPAWSPDGKKILFVSERDSSAEIYVVDLKGGDEIRLTTSSDDGDPAWSPDGHTIPLPPGAMATGRSMSWRPTVRTRPGSRAIRTAIGFPPGRSMEGASRSHRIGRATGRSTKSMPRGDSDRI